MGYNEFNRPNLLRIFLLKDDTLASNENILEGAIWERVVYQQAWIDDASPEDLAILIDHLKLAGAIEVVSQPVLMKNVDFPLKSHQQTLDHSSDHKQL